MIEVDQVRYSFILIQFNPDPPLAFPQLPVKHMTK